MFLVNVIYVLKVNIYKELLVSIVSADAKFVLLSHAQHVRILTITNHQLMNVFLFVIQDFLAIQPLKHVTYAIRIVKHV